MRRRTTKPDKGGLLFKARFRPRGSVADVEQRVFLCPACRTEVRQSTETCPHCGARRRFGPTWIETSIAMTVGGVAGLTYCLTILDRLVWIFPCVALGLLAGFYIAHIRFDGDRWQAKK